MAYINGNEILFSAISGIGEVKETLNVTPAQSEQTINAQTGVVYDTVVVSPVDSSIDSNITADNIKKDVTILGVTGTLENFLQWKCDNLKTLTYEFNGYEGTSLDEYLIGLDTSQVKSMSYMFYQCGELTSIPPLDLSSCTNVYMMFNYCYALTTIPLLDLRNVTNANQFLYNCQALTNLTLKNIKISLTIGSGSTYGHLLTLDSLINTIKELWDWTGSTSAHQLIMGTTNKSKLSGVYVKLIDVTDEMIAEDENIASKMPCEVCESTDEGAMTIFSYISLKNWTYA